MVLPLGGSGLGPPGPPTMPTGPPPAGVLRSLPYLRLGLVFLFLVVVAEVVAGYYNEALIDALTLVIAVPAIRDPPRFGQCVLCIAMITALNSAYDVVTIVMLLSGRTDHIPGGRYFFATECSGMRRVLDRDTGKISVEVYEACSWRTILGNCAIVVGACFQCLCFRISSRMFKAYQEEAMARLDELEGFDGLAAAYGGLPRGGYPGLAGPGDSPSAMAEVGLANSSAGGAGGARGPGFTPFSGQGQRLQLSELAWDERGQPQRLSG